MSCNCTPLTKKLTLYSFAAFFLICSLLLGVLWPSLSLKMVYSKLVLEEGSINYENWIETPIPMYLDIYLYNYDNPEDLNTPGIKPHFTERGPYSFQEIHKRVGIIWHDNATVSFNTTRTWHFNEERSIGSLDDTITNINTIAATIASVTKIYPMFSIVMTALFDQRGVDFIITKTIRELIFDGYDDPVLEFLEEYKDIFPPNLPIPNIPFDKFGWFVDRNNSADADGRFTIFTGADDIKNLGMMNLWNHESKTSYFSDECSDVYGSTGVLWPPLDLGKDISMFPTDLCRAITLKYDGKASKHGINGGRWIGDDQLFDNGEKYPEQECSCTADKEFCPTMPPGVANMSDCKFGAPAFVSYPHFYLADESFIDATDGIPKPNREDDELFIILEPTTGIPLHVRAQFQINVWIESIPGLMYFDGIPDLMVPMLWFKQEVILPEDLAGDAKLAVLIPELGLYIAYAFAGIGVILVCIGTFLTVTKRWEGAKNERILTNNNM